MSLENEITKIKNKILTNSEVVEWLEHNATNSLAIVLPTNCYNRILPCFCYNRSINCIFKDIFSVLSEHASKYNLNIELGEELRKYEEIQHDKEKINSWLENIVKLHLDILWVYMAQNYPNIILRFINGKQTDEFEYFQIQLKGKDFQNIYDIANITSYLFFEKKVLPDLYNKWKSSNDL